MKCNYTVLQPLSDDEREYPPSYFNDCKETESQLTDYYGKLYRRIFNLNDISHGLATKPEYSLVEHVFYFFYLFDLFYFFIR